MLKDMETLLQGVQAVLKADRGACDVCGESYEVAGKAYAGISWAGKPIACCDRCRGDMAIMMMVGLRNVNESASPELLARRKKELMLTLREEQTATLH